MSTSLGSLAIVTTGIGIGAFVIMGAHNASMGQGKFLPDGLLAGGSITLSMKTLDYLASKIVDGLISIAPYFQSLGMPLNPIVMQASSVISETKFPALANSTSSWNNFFDNHFSVNFGVDYVYSSGDNKKAFFLYMTIQLSSQQTNVISGSVYTGAVWNMPEFEVVLLVSGLILVWVILLLVLIILQVFPQIKKDYIREDIRLVGILDRQVKSLNLNFQVPLHFHGDHILKIEELMTKFYSRTMPVEYEI
jgi:hypothetical protein